MSREEIFEFYKEIEAMKLKKEEDINILTVDFNTKVGKGRYKDIIGEWVGELLN